MTLLRNVLIAEQLDMEWFPLIRFSSMPERCLWPLLVDYTFSLPSRPSLTDYFLWPEPLTDWRVNMMTPSHPALTPVPTRSPTLTPSFIWSDCKYVSRSSSFLSTSLPYNSIKFEKALLAWETNVNISKAGEELGGQNIKGWIPNILTSQILEY